MYYLKYARNVIIRAPLFHVISPFILCQNYYCRKWVVIQISPSLGELVLYVVWSYADSCRMNHNETMIKTDAMNDWRRKTSLTIFTSHFIARVRKGLLKVCVWEGAGDRTELKYFDLHSYGRQRCVFLVLLMLNRRSRGPLCWVMASFTASYQHLLWFPNSTWNSNWHSTSVMTALYNSSTPTRSPTWSLKSNVES